MKILNAGCGDDFSIGTHFIDLYPTNQDVIKCDIDSETFPFPNEFFDEVYAKCVFEHLTNHKHFMEESRRVLKKGGKLVIITDNASFITFWGGKYWGSIGYQHDYRGVYGEEDNHYALFTPAHLENWCAKFRFEIDNIQYEKATWGSESGIMKIIKPIAFSLLPEHLASIRLRLTAIKK